jgi:hypothetical protein
MDISLKNKYDVFQKFHDVQNHVGRLFDKKILAMQTDWGGEYQKLTSFSASGYFPPCFLSSWASTEWSCQG